MRRPASPPAPRSKRLESGCCFRLPAGVTTRTHSTAPHASKRKRGLLDEDELAAELGLDGDGLEGLGADISGDFGDDFGADFDMAGGEGAQRAAKDGEES